MAKLPQISITELLESGVHFGHKASRWNPKMAPYIHGTRDGVHIIDLKQTAGLMNIALNAIYEVVRNNGKVLFVGTKIQASSIIAEYAEKCGQYFVNHRWLGGMLTNWGTVSKSIKRLEALEKILSDEKEVESYTKKEILDLSRKKEKLDKAFGGIRNMGGKPDLIILIDTNKEHIARKEAKVLHIPIIGVVDTNSDPDNLEYPVPGNDDAIRSITYYCDKFSLAVLAGIEDSLVSSGVDLGELAEGSKEEFAAASKVTKLKTSNKVSKSVVVTEEENVEVEEAHAKEAEAEVESKGGKDE
ncbi:MAG UNVERIFIED_CONTAM: 30S ribosomal protein S2 [Rickettsiaceae bacterium]|jgi:small subunit ribosomal protein S2